MKADTLYTYPSIDMIQTDNEPNGHGMKFSLKVMENPLDGRPLQYSESIDGFVQIKQYGSEYKGSWQFVVSYADRSIGLATDRSYLSIREDDGTLIWRIDQLFSSVHRTNRKRGGIAILAHTTYFESQEEQTFVLQAIKDGLSVFGGKPSRMVNSLQKGRCIFTDGLQNRINNFEYIREGSHIRFSAIRDIYRKSDRKPR